MNYTYEELEKMTNEELLVLHRDYEHKEIIENILIANNENMIREVLNHFKTRYVLNNYEDCYSELSIKLWQCIGKYDYTKGYKFSTFAMFSLKNMIKQILEMDSRKKREKEKDMKSTNELAYDKENSSEIQDFIVDSRVELESKVLIKTTMDLFLPTLSSREREILNLRDKGYSDREIASLFDCSFTYVANIRRKLKDKYYATYA